MIPVAKPFLGTAEAKAARQAILSGWVTQGPKVLEFEKVFTQHVGAKYACAVSNCTTALHLALLAIGIKPGDKVITVSHSFIATANAISYCGAQPVFIDIDLDTYNMSADSLSKLLRDHVIPAKAGILDPRFRGDDSKIKAILVVHQIGMPVDMKSILAIARKYKIPVIEDAACAIGSEIKINGRWEKIGKPHGDIACFSFHPRKVITTGEGGMLTTNNPKYDAQFRLLRHQGMSVSDLARHKSKKYIFEDYPIVGYNYRLTDIQAAIGIEQMKKLDKIIKRRRKLAEIYFEELGNIDWLQLPYEPDYARSNWQSFAVRVLPHAPVKRDHLMQKLLDSGISSRPGIMNAHEEKPYKHFKVDLPISQWTRRTALLLPLYYQMTDKEIKMICQTLKRIAS